MKNKRYSALFVLVSLVLLLVSSCSDIVVLDGRVKIDLVFEETDFPAGTTLHLKGTGPSTIVQERTIDSELTTVPLELEPGDWTFTITAKDVNGAKLGEGTTTYKIAPGKIVPIAIQVISDNAVKFDLQYVGAIPIGQLTTVVFGSRYMDHVDWPTNPTRAGYTFTGWNIKADGSEVAINEDSIYKEAQTLYAQWTANKYSVIFDSAGGSDVDTITQEYGSALVAPANPTKTGYTFDSWDPALPATMPVDGLATTATWNINQYTLTFDSTGGSDVAPITQDYNTAITAPANPTRVGYTFAGWDVAIPSEMPAENMTITATWSANKYSVIFDSAGGSDVDTITQEYGSALVAPANPTKAGYTFVSWDPALPATMPVDGLATTATWNINQYTLTFDSTGGSDVASITQDYNTAITAPDAPTRTGYTFASWDPVLPATMPVDGLTTTATWNINQYTLTFDSAGGSDVAPITQDYNTVITAPEDPTRSGYTFASWDVAIPSKMPAVDSTITANWTVNKYSVIFDSDGGTAVADLELDFGATITAPTAPTKTGYTFASWDPALPATMPVDGFATTATWNINQYTLTFDSTGGSYVAPMTQDYNTAITAPEDPTRTGYTFASWDVAIPSKMPAVDTTITANWTVNKYSVIFDSDGGTAVADLELDFGATITAPTAPTKTGYTFASWDPALPATMPVDGYATKAIWTANKNTSYQVEHYKQDLSGSGYTEVEIENLTGTTAATATASAKVYTGFSENTTHESRISEGAIQGDGSLVLKLYYDRNTYRATYYSNSATGGTVPTFQTKIYGGELSLATNSGSLVRTGYTFAGWNTQADGLGATYAEGSTYTVPAEDTTFYAKWNAISRMITFDVQGGNALVPNTMTVTYDQPYGELPTTTREEYYFDGWWTGTDGSGSLVKESTIFTGTNNITLYAKWRGAIVGDIGPSGGYIFYDDYLGYDANNNGTIEAHEKNRFGDDLAGKRYLEAAPANWYSGSGDPRFTFGYNRTPGGSNETVGTSTGIGTGKANTAALIVAMGDEAYRLVEGTDKAMYAAKASNDYSGGGYSDWFLPSKDELNQIYLNLKKDRDLGGFGNDYYWSSSESGGKFGWANRFSSTEQSQNYREYKFLVRPVRAF